MELIAEYGGEDKIPDHFNPDKLSPIHPDAVAWWDKSHKDCVVSDFGKKAKTKTQFPCNTNGEYDPDGKYLDAGTERTLKKQ